MKSDVNGAGVSRTKNYRRYVVIAKYRIYQARLLFFLPYNIFWNELRQIQRQHEQVVPQANISPR